jgi:hypothetical protein
MKDNLLEKLNGLVGERHFHQKKSESRHYIQWCWSTSSGSAVKHPAIPKFCADDYETDEDTTPATTVTDAATNEPVY